MECAQIALFALRARVSALKHNVPLKTNFKVTFSGQAPPHDQSAECELH